MNVRDEIQTKLAAYRSRLKQSFGHPEYRAALLQLLRCVDLQTVAGFSRFYAGLEPDESENTPKIKNLYGWGLNEALSLFWGEHVHQPGIPIFQTRQEENDWGESLLQCSARIRLIEQALEMERVQLAKISRVSEDIFECVYSESASGVEKLEKQDLDIFNVLLGRHYKREGAWDKLEARRPEIIKRMRSLVHPWREHYICYDAVPEVDDFYHDLSFLVARTRLGFDCFPTQAMFGGLPFGKYIECVRVLMGFAFKHMDFCLLLCGQHPKIQPIDIISVPCVWVDAVRYMSYALNVPESEAEQLLLATTLTPENAQHHLRIPAGPLACQYMFGRGSAVRSITGCLENPFQFMLRELHRKFPIDWDKSVDDREAIFRDDIYRIFSSFNRVACFTDNVNINTSAGKTDIDALAVDVASKVVGVFQLKWQDLFASSMRERESKKANFLKSNAWVEKVSRWLAEGKMPETLISLGLPKEVATQIKKTRLFVIGRNFSHFSGDCPMDERAAWGTWPQILRLLEVKSVGESPITILHDQLILDSPHKRAQKSKSREEIKIPNMTLVSHFETQL
jgi:hypothetical protein